MACDFYWFFCRWPRILEFEFVKPGWNHRNPGTTYSPDHLWTYFRFRRTIVRCCPNRCLPETSKFSHTLQKFRICKFILIPMSQCPKNNYFYFFQKICKFVQKLCLFVLSELYVGGHIWVSKVQAHWVIWVSKVKNHIHQKHPYPKIILNSNPILLNT